jgi:predicted RNase H-like HicB family nuclease
MKLKVLVCPEKVGGYSVSVPALPGCYSQGETMKDALSNIREAAELWLEVTAKRATRSKSKRKGVALQEIEL